MDNNGKKKSKIGLIILIIIILLLLLCCVWFFLLKDKDKDDNKNSNNNTQEKGNTNNDNPKDTKSKEYDYRDGILHVIVDEEGNPKQTDFVIDGIILVGNRHEYREEDTTISNIDYFVQKGYKKEGINSSFFLSEWIEFYIDTKYSGRESDVEILVTPHKTVEELEKMSLSQLEDLANENGGFIISYEVPDEENHKYVGNGYISPDSKEGKYDILFTYKGKLAYYINIEAEKEYEE